MNNEDDFYTRRMRDADADVPKAVQTGGPVYPVLAACRVSAAGGIDNTYASIGLSLRNHVALTVLAAIVAHKGPTIDPMTRERQCCTALDYADAFIAAERGTAP